MTMAKWLLYRNRRYIPVVATDLYGMQWFDSNEVGELARVLQRWGAQASPKVGRVFWHDGKNKWLLVPGMPAEKEVAEYLAKDDPEKFEKEQRDLRPVSYDELEDKCRRCMGIEWNLIRNVFKEYGERKQED